MIKEHTEERARENERERIWLQQDVTYSSETTCTDPGRVLKVNKDSIILLLRDKVAFGLATWVALLKNDGDTSDRDERALEKIIHEPMSTQKIHLVAYMRVVLTADSGSGAFASSNTNDFYHI